jgi:hypothetical protein
MSGHAAASSVVTLKLVADFEKRTAQLRSKRIWLFGFFPMIALVFGTLLPTLGRGHLFFPFLAVYTACLASVVVAMERWRRMRRGHLRASAQGLFLDGQLVIKRSSVLAGHMGREGDRAYVRLVRFPRLLRFVDVTVDDEGEGEKLLSALGVDASGKAARYRFGLGTMRSAMIRLLSVSVPVLGATVAIGRMGAPILLMFLLLGCYLAYVAHQYVNVLVGTDGVYLRRNLGRPRFLPYAQIRSVRHEGAEVMIDLADGSSVTMHGGGSGKGRWSKRLARDAIADMQGFADRVNGQLAAHRSPSASASVAALARGSRSIDTWLRDISATDENQARYRVAAIPKERLWRIVEDASAAPTARAAAAVVLRDSLDETSRARLHATSEACAAPKLRVVLDAVAEACDEQKLAEALGPLEDEAVQRL